MKKLLSIVLVAALCVCCASLCACVFNGEDVVKLAQKCDAEKTLTANETADISVEIESDVYRIYVYETEKSALAVRYVQSRKTTVTTQVNTTTDETIEKTAITITEKTDGNLSYEEAKNAFLLVEIPRSWQKRSLKITADVGYVNVSDMRFVSIDITTDAGAICVDDCHADNDISVVAVSGSVEVNADAKRLIVKTSTGSVDANGTFSDEVILNASTGSIKADVHSNGLFVDVKTGSVRFECDATVIKVETSTGSVRGVVEASKSLYTIAVSTGTGSSNISNQNGDGIHRLDVETGTGSINIKFDK